MFEFDLVLVSLNVNFFAINSSMCWEEFLTFLGSYVGRNIDRIISPYLVHFTNKSQIKIEFTWGTPSIWCMTFTIHKSVLNILFRNLKYWIAIQSIPCNHWKINLDSWCPTSLFETSLKHNDPILILWMHSKLNQDSITHWIYKL